MRTKTLLGIAALAVSTLAVSAQSNVYSLNIVGYVNVPVKGGGFTLAANQLDFVSGGVTNNSLNNVIPTTSIGSQVLTFVNNDYTVDIFDGTEWLDNSTGNPSVTTLDPGQGFFFQNVDVTSFLSLVGQVRQGTNLTVAIPPGTTLISTVTPRVLDLSSNSFPQVYGMQALVYDNTINDYKVYINDGTEWLDNGTGETVTFAPITGQGFFIQNLDSVTYTWTNSFVSQ
jgi:hypothetical protein